MTDSGGQDARAGAANKEEVMHNEEKHWPLVLPRRTPTLTRTRLEQFRKNTIAQKPKCNKEPECIRSVW